MSLNGINNNSSLGDMFKNIFGAANGTSSSGFLSDYASIRNGSYKKLMNAYYGKNEKSRASEIVGSKAYNKPSNKYIDSTGLSAAKSATKSLQDSISTLMDRKKNVFKKDSDGNYDVDKIYDAVNSFVKGYNEMLNVSDTLEDEGTLNKILSMARYTKSNSSALDYAGITFNNSGEMVLDKEKFSRMDMNAVKNMFQGAGSYASQMLSKVTAIGSTAAVNLNKASGVYGRSGSYNNYLDTGDKFKGLF